MIGHSYVYKENDPSTGLKMNESQPKSKHNFIKFENYLSKPL